MNLMSAVRAGGVAAVFALSTVCARSDTLTLGYLDLAGGPLTQVGQSGGQTIQLINVLLGSGFGFGQFTTLLIPNGADAPIFETAWNDGFVPPQGGTIRLYGSWQGAITAGDSITLPTIFQSEMPAGANGFSVTEQVFLCAGAGAVFCDNFPSAGAAGAGGGIAVGSDQFTDASRTDFVTLTGLAPFQPFTINEVFTFAQDRCCIASLPQGDVAAAILTTPIAQVPGPIVGAGLPGLAVLLGLMPLVWRRRVLRWWDDRSTWHRG